ncbi:hypothetical protein J4444_01750 [Candidatus Woesearchaeota archaeon]|nr:hypothetical protein [Candidatus Woesearchaeota archaeon]
MENLFLNLEKYSGSRKTTRHEEFFTQLFSFILDGNKDMLKKFVSFLIGEHFFLASDLQTKLKITPESLERGIGRFDFRIESDNDLLIIIENKVGARIHRKKKDVKENLDDEEVEQEVNQLEGYSSWLIKQTHKQKYLVLITSPYFLYVPIEEQFKNKDVKFSHKSWSEVHYFLVTYFNETLGDNTNKKESFLVDQLIKYMEGENMKSWKPLISDDDNKIVQTWKTYTNINNLLGDASAIFSRLLKKKLKNTSSKIEDSVPLIYKNIQLNTLNIVFGINGSDKEEKLEFSFFIELYSRDNKSNKSFEELQREIPEGYILESEDGKWFMRIEFKLKDDFLKNSYIEQKKMVEYFITKTIDDLKSIID